MAMSMRKNGYSVIEGLIIISLLAMVTVVVSPAFVHAWQSVRSSQLQRLLALMRRQISQYEYDHGGRGPHLNELGELDTENMIERLTSSTYTSGRLSKLAPCGPYIHEWPANPLCDRSVALAVKFGWAPAPPRDGTTGWYYNIDTCLISSNSAGPEEYVAPVSVSPSAPYDTEILNQKDIGLRLKGIFNGPDGMVAFVNTERLRVGDTINGAKVVKITWDSVALQMDGHREVLQLAPRGQESPEAAAEMPEAAATDLPPERAPARDADHSRGHATAE